MILCYIVFISRITQLLCTAFTGWYEISIFVPLNGSYDNINEKSFHYWIEAAIAALADLNSDNDAGKLEFIGSINGTPPL
jgi:hypothetical protein